MLSNPELEAYLQQRWESLTEDTKRILRIGPDDFWSLRLLWTKQWLEATQPQEKV